MEAPETPSIHSQKDLIHRRSRRCLPMYPLALDVGLEYDYCCSQTDLSASRTRASELGGGSNLLCWPS